MLTDYKIKRIVRKPNGDAEIVMVVYEGDITTEKELDLATDKLVDITRYRRTATLREYLKTVSGQPTDDKLREHCDVELNTDGTRTSIDGQKRTAVRE